ncbi:sugar phosphate nucleotidyltransferase [Paenibacillus sp. GCM10012307]|uniref:Cupin domain-containing protein n=1 Tax=Paenibacillus roseus TaxID=2798579 RepID=A0A934J039_9BACL|nr:sugar phosphate nucleotidyltransferase [Paenibacillus roseus]MBJ6360255.1 cupin domain-containing protein [Paenibacillus roseus]
MKIVLLSGGSGKRLWPLSNESRSKQFLKVLEGPNGQLESMVQRVWRQLHNAGLANDVCFATSKSQEEIFRNQLGSRVNVVLEPERRDTFPAIALVATYLYSIQGVGLNETIVIMPVDPYVNDDFFDDLVALPNILAQSDAKIALIGVKPDHPSENYGYIMPEQQLKNDKPFYMSVKKFEEKPKKEKAAALIEQGALWNCGVFAFKLDLIINLLIELNIPIQYDEMLKQYNKLPNISFDYQVVEKIDKIAAMVHEGKWKDLGTWDTLTSEMGNKVVGGGIVTPDSQNTHLINELEIPVTIIGASNLVVAASPDGILVSDKQQSFRIKDVLKHTDHRPMYEERRWGYYKVIDYIKYSHHNEVLTKRICIYAGRNLSYQYHWKRDEIWTVVSGEGELIQDGSYRKVKSGDVVKIPSGSKHSLRAITNLEIIEVQTGTELIEEDIHRISMSWEDILKSIQV